MIGSFFYKRDMGYRNKTYVIFDGDDINYYRIMQAWKGNDYIDFDFNDAHDIGGVRPDSEEETVKKHLRERFANSKQVLVLIGDNTKYKTKYVRWEIEAAQRLDLPIIAVNLNKKHSYNPDFCPTLLKDKCVIHVSINKDIIKYALDHFPDFYDRNKNDLKQVNLRYKESVYTDLGY